jgi:hypothetical protein
MVGKQKHHGHMSLSSLLRKPTLKFTNHGRVFGAFERFLGSLVMIFGLWC